MLDSGPRRAAAHGELLLGLGEFLLEPLALLDELRDPPVDFANRRFHQRSEVTQLAALRVELMARGVAGRGLDATHAGRDRAFADDTDEPDVAGATHMGPAAELHRPSQSVGARQIGFTHGDDANFVAVFLTEQRPGSRLHRLVGCHYVRGDLGVAQHLRVGEILDLGDLLLVHRLGMREVEPKAIGGDQRTLLCHVIAQHLAQRLVQQVGRRVIGANVGAAGMIDGELERAADTQRAFFDRYTVAEHVARELACVGDARGEPIRMHDADVADLAAGLRVERGLVENDDAALAGGETFDLLAVAHDRLYDALGILGFVAEEIGRTGLFAQREPDRIGLGLARAGPRRARHLALAFHRGVERLDVDIDAAGSKRILGQVERKPVGVVERERDVALEPRAAAERLGLFIEDRKPALERLAKAPLLELERFGDQRLGAHQFRIGLPHLAHQHRHELEHQRILGAEQLGMAHGATHDAAEHVAAAFVARKDAVGDQERARAQVIGDHPMRDLLRADRIDAGCVGHRLDQRAEEVDRIIVVRSLQHRGDALEPHAGIDRGPRQVDALVRGDLLELHEHQVPDLDEAIAVGIGRAGRSTRDMLAVVVEDLRTRPARADLAHGPEIIRAGDTNDLAVGQPGDFFPQRERIVVIDVDGDQQALDRQLEFPGEQVPGKLDRVLLEIVTEGEVPEHLKEGVMAGRVADVVEVVVLAAGAHAFLRGDRARVGPLFQAGEHVLELHHPGVGEHQGRVVARHERRGRHGGVTVLFEKLDEGRPDLVNAAHELVSCFRRLYPFAVGTFTSVQSKGTLATL